MITMAPDLTSPSLFNIHLRTFPIFLMLLLQAFVTTQAGSYSQRTAIHDALLSNGSYNPNERPLLDQNDVLHVNVLFEMVSIVEINDVVQSFKCNGFLGMTWLDEILTWNSSDYGGEESITPKVTSVFRPRVVMLNTLGDRDIFEDDNAPMTLYSWGFINWVPGTIFPASCKLDLTKFPVDEQHCEIQMVIMNYNTHQLQFVPDPDGVGTAFFTENGLWEITHAFLTTPNLTVRGETMASISVNFDVKRKPTFIVISVLLPTLFLSVLNLLVFVIPVDSGEKISYGITVLLALTVFMSIMSSMLPRSSESMPLIISYTFSLLTISVLTVAVTVIIVKLHHMEEKEERSQRARARLQTAVRKIGFLRTAVAPLEETAVNYHCPQGGEKFVPGANCMEGPKTSISTGTGTRANVEVNKYKLVGKYIDMVSLVVFTVAWVSVTVGYMSAIAS